MIQLDILYPNIPGCHFDMAYYLERHMPLSRRLFGEGCKGIRIERGIAGTTPGSAPDILVGCHMLFDSIDGFLDAWLAHGELLGGDIANYTDVQPMIQFSEPLPFD